MRAMPMPKNRDLDETRARLERWLARHLPEASNLAITNLRGPSDTGFSSDTLLLDLARSEAGERRVDRYVVRIQPRGFNVFPSYDLTVQYRVMEALAKTDVPVPRMFWHEWSDEVLDAQFYVMELLDGWVPSDNPPMHTAGRVAEELGPAEREALWWSGVDALCRVHQVDPYALGLDFLEEPERGETPLVQHLQYYEEFFAWGVEERERYPLIIETLDWLQRERPGGGDRPVLGRCAPRQPDLLGHRLHRCDRLGDGSPRRSGGRSRLVDRDQSLLHRGHRRDATRGHADP